MRSQVARHVLRRLPATRGVATSLLASPPPRPASCLLPIGCRVAGAVQRRSFFNLFQKPPRTLKAIEAEPGYETLLTYRAAENDSLRPPPVTDLELAWKQFFTYKKKQCRVVNSTQALCAHRVLEYLCRTDVVETVSLSLDDLHIAMQCLGRPPRDDPRHHLELSRALFSEIRRRELNIPSAQFNNTTLEYCLEKSQDQSKYLHTFLVVLSQYGAAVEAKTIFLENFPEANKLECIDLLPVISGLAREGNERALRETVREALNSGVPYDFTIQSVMTTFFARRDNFEDTKLWWTRPLRRGLHPSPQAFSEVLRLALRINQKEWAIEIYEKLIARLEEGSLSSSKACWDVSFQYAYLLLEKGPEEIEHMFHVAFEHTKNKPESQPNIGSINSLLECAIDKNDPYMAERFISLSKKMGFEPDLSTYILQLEYRLRASDFNGAFASFLELRNLDTSVGDRELPVLNKLIRGFCESSRPAYEKILEVTSFLEQRHVTLEPETVVSICMTFLKNDETYEVIDTLSLHTTYYSIAERHMVRKSFVDYCLDKKNSTARVWDAYALLRQFFPEVEKEDRIAIMDAFFERRRSDMACHVFGHMRAHDNPRFRPSLETYVRCLEGIGQCPDAESLRTIHNMMKMDTNIQLNTLLYNALMIGYTACDMPHRALDYWREVTSSREGPSYASLEIIFRTYEVQPYGDAPAKELWAKIMTMEVDISENVYAAYLTTLAAHSHVPDAKALLEDYDSIIGQRPNFMTFAHVFNALPSKEMKSDFEAWAQKEFPHIWSTLIKRQRRRKDEDELPQFKVPRPWKAG